MAPIERKRSLRVLLSDEELGMLHTLADRDGLTVSDVVRQLARRAYADAFGDAKPKRPKRRR